MKRGDTKQAFLYRLEVDGVVPSLTGATVRFILRGAGRVIAQVAEVLTPAGPDDPNVRYQPTADDVSVAGKYQVEWEVTWDDGRVLTFPNRGKIALTIEEDLNAQ